MTREAFRITQTRHLPRAFDGEGARRFGGRWNSPGTAVVYTAGSLSLATLEILVHVEDVTTIYDRYSVVPVQFEDALVADVAAGDLPEDWDAPQPSAATQLIGDGWVRAGTSAILRVPSAVTPSESNYLLSPAHPDFAGIRIGDGRPFEPDPRLAS